MKYTKQEKNWLIKNTVKLLQAATRPAKCERLGYMHATTKEEVDANDKMAVRAVFTGTQYIPVNHERAVRKIIEQARNEAGLIDALGAYVAKYGSPALKAAADEAAQTPAP